MTGTSYLPNIHQCNIYSHGRLADAECATSALQKIVRNEKDKKMGRRRDQDEDIEPATLQVIHLFQ